MIGAWLELTKYLKFDKVTIDNGVFRLHYKLTFLLLMACSIILTLKDFFGKPIHCISTIYSNGKAVPEDFANTYCWISGTYAVHSTDKSVDGMSLGLLPDPSDAKDQRTEYKYYQWVCLILFFQAVLFTIPRLIWKYLEGGVTQLLVQDMKTVLVKPVNPGSIQIFVDKAEMEKRIHSVVDYFIKFRGVHSCLIFKLLMCETLNFLNVLAQMCFMDWLLGGEFRRYGLEVIQFLYTTSYEERHDPMDKVFPKMTKCKFNYFGPGGGLESQDFLCTLPLNVVNEKTYALLWFWFAFLAVISGLAIIYRFVNMVFFKPINVHKLQVLSPCCNNQIRIVCRYFTMGDLFLVSQFKENVEPIMYEYFINKLVLRITDKAALNGDNAFVTENIQLIQDSSESDDEDIRKPAKSGQKKPPKVGLMVKEAIARGEFEKNYPGISYDHHEPGPHEVYSPKSNTGSQAQATPKKKSKPQKVRELA